MGVEAPKVEPEKVKNYSPHMSVNHAHETHPRALLHIIRN